MPPELPSVDEALATVLAEIAVLPAARVPLSAAAGRVLRQPIVADRDFPPFDRATLDGLALRAADVVQGRRDLLIDGFQAAGHAAAPLPLRPRIAREIATGAVVPEGADTVLGYEDVELSPGQASLRPGVAVRPGLGIHRRGSDFPAGTTLVAAGAVLGPAELAVAAAVGASALEVASLPRLTLITTGDELVPVTGRPLPHEIRRSNDIAVQSLLARHAPADVLAQHLADDQSATEQLLLRASGHQLGSADLIVCIGGASRGRRDHVAAAIESLGGRFLVRGVAQRPGRPLGFALLARNGRQVPVLLLPGNPVSALVAARRYVVPALHRLVGAPASPPLTAALAEPFEVRPPLTFFLPGRLEGVDGRLQVRPRPVQNSGDFATLVGTDGVLEIGPGPVVHPAGTVGRWWGWT